MSLTRYVTSLAEVRSILGVSSDEIEDGDIDTVVYRFQLEESLRALDSTIISTYETVCAIDLGDRTAVQRRFHDAVRTYSTFHVASSLLTGLPNSAPKTITDEKSMVQRQAGALYDTVRVSVRKALGTAETSLLDAIVGLTGAAVTEFSPFLGVQVSTPTSDPVTGT